MDFVIFYAEALNQNRIVNPTVKAQNDIKINKSD
jgi:hypothetical protein